jgi:hypothetical protein
MNVSPRPVRARYGDIDDAATRQRFSTEWLDQQMKHYRDLVAAGDALDKER